MKRVEISPAALQELDVAVDWYDERTAGAGQRLHDEVFETIDKIREFPEQGGRYLRTKYRHRRTTSFPYVIIYSELADLIHVVAIAHASRRPGYWKGRE